jgi:hypothetical protein
MCSSIKHIIPVHAQVVSDSQSPLPLHSIDWVGIAQQPVVRLPLLLLIVVIPFVLFAQVLINFIFIKLLDADPAEVASAKACYMIASVPFDYWRLALRTLFHSLYVSDLLLQSQILLAVVKRMAVFLAELAELETADMTIDEVLFGLGDDGGVALGLGTLNQQVFVVI